MSQRTCVGTVQRIIEVIPPGEPLRADLEKFMGSIFLELPEANRHLWIAAARILEKHLGPFANEDQRPAWQFTAERIWDGRETSETP